MLVEWYLAFRKGESHFLWAAFLTLVITNLVAFRTATTNYVVLLPVLFYIFKFIQSRFRIAGSIVTWLLLIVLWAGLWTLFLVTVNGNIEHPIMYIPLPFICLAGLWWVRWWATQAPRMPLEAYLKKFPG
jgi:uncharacterized membrane protein